MADHLPRNMAQAKEEEKIIIKNRKTLRNLKFSTVILLIIGTMIVASGLNYL